MKKRVYGTKEQTNDKTKVTEKRKDRRGNFILDFLPQFIFVAIALVAIIILLSINNWWGDVAYWLNPFAEGNGVTLWVYLAILLLGCIAGVLVWKKRIGE